VFLNMTIRHSLFAVAATVLTASLQAQEVKPKPVDTTPKLAYGLLLKQGEKMVFSPCRDRSYAIMEDISPERSVTRALNVVGLDAGKKMYVELVGVVEGGVLKASGFNMAQSEGRCQLPGTKDEVWRASGNEPGWVLAAGGDKVTLKQPGKPDVNVPYTPFTQQGGLALFEATTEAGSLSVRLENTLCRDTMADAVFSWSATVTRNGQALKGCAWAR
jgi:putative lipoprotein